MRVANTSPGRRNAVEYTTKKVCEILDRDRKTQADDIATGHCGHVPEAVGSLRFWEQDDIAAERWFMDLRAEGYPVRIAGALASRLRSALRFHPDAPQLTLVTLENGNRFALPADALNLTDGFTSGCAVREAVMVDARNLRERVQSLIDAAAQIVGDRDEG